MLPPSSLTALRHVLAQFVADEIEAVEAYGGGHIHDTFLAHANSGKDRWIVQRFNERVFADIALVMSNIVRVTDHARQQLQQRGVADLARRVLSVRRTHSGEHYFRDSDGSAFRVFPYVAGSTSYRVAPDARIAYEAGRAFGEFAGLLRELPGPPLAVTIPGFHDTAARLVLLRDALARDPHGRAAGIAREWAFIEERAELASECSRLAAQGVLPLRVTHNDTKLDNALLDASAQTALCVVDLDTVMPGYLAHDFGDLVRSTAGVGGEDSRDLAQVGIRLDYFEAVAAGYLREVGSLEAAERETLVAGTRWILLELAIRFLTDHLLGDTYFKIERPGHNLDRVRVQMQLVRAFEQQREALQRVWDGLQV